MIVSGPDQKCCPNDFSESMTSWFNLNDLAICGVLSSLSSAILFLTVSSTLLKVRKRSWVKVDADVAAWRFDLGSFGE